jgi:hypothetical protein
LKDAGNTFKGLDGPISTGYAVLTASLLAAGLGYIFAPALTLQGVSRIDYLHRHGLILTIHAVVMGGCWLCYGTATTTVWPVSTMACRCRMQRCCQQHTFVVPARAAVLYGIFAPMRAAGSNFV